MSIFQQIDELNAELKGCLLTKIERDAIKRELATAMAEAAMLEQTQDEEQAA
jgi:hypothetical protein